MRARDLATEVPTVTSGTHALAAARLLSQERLPGLIVVDDAGRPFTVLPGSQVLRYLVPRYVQDEPPLARAYDEKASDELCAKLTTSTVGELLPAKPDLDELPVVDHDATTIEVAAVMARTHTPLVAVVDDDGRLVGGITVRHLLERLLPDA
jgi:CBS domain-containing protein